MADIKNQRIFLTGCTGFIGTRLVQALSDNNDIFCLCRKCPLCDSKGNIEYIKHDFINPLRTDKLPKEVDIIIHLAASFDKPRSPGKIEMYKVNTLSTLELLEYGKRAGIDLFLYASTGGVYGYGEMPFKESDLVSPFDFYTLTKYIGELLVNSYEETFITIINRYFFPYGPGQVNRFIPLMIANVMQKQQILTNTHGGPIVNPLYITDVVQLTINTLKSKRGDIFNIAGLEKYSLMEIADLIGKYVGQEPMYRCTDEIPSGDIVGDVTKIIKKIDFKVVPFVEGLRRTIESILNK
jgi:nucleoside-diphosphate-sugar epimerase